jgi:cytochrome subunit of sulfide dehydrogenase
LSHPSFALAIALLLPMQPARADEGAQLAATCTGCHGTNGITVGDALPSLAGQPKAALLASLKAFKSGERSATVMTQIAKGYSDEQIERIAAFFAAQKSQPKAGTTGASGAIRDPAAAGASAVPPGAGS